MSMDNQEQEELDGGNLAFLGCFVFSWLLCWGLFAFIIFESADTPDERWLFVFVFLMRASLEDWQEWGFALKIATLSAFIVLVVIWVMNLWIIPFGKNIVDRIQEWIEWG